MTDVMQIRSPGTYLLGKFGVQRQPHGRPEWKRIALVFRLCGKDVASRGIRKEGVIHGSVRSRSKPSYAAQHAEGTSYVAAAYVAIFAVPHDGSATADLAGP